MPSILNLKFKGNKSFVPFSNLGDVDSLTKTWKVCTKVASFLEQGQRLENLSWRLWHLQNLMVDTDNAKSKREFRKLSKCMGDKLDKEKGRSIEELQAPGFRRNHSTDVIQQRALEREREREANQNRNGTLHRMQFTFSVDQPAAPATSTPCQKPDLKPSAEFKDNKRGRPATRASNSSDSKDQPLTQRGRKQSTTSADANVSNATNDPTHLQFPSIFSSDFGPSALLYPSPTLTNVMTYGEGLNTNTHNNADPFSIARPTIELPLDEILNADSPGGWSGVFNGSEARQGSEATFGSQEEADMKPMANDVQASTSASAYNERPREDESMLSSASALRGVPHVVEDVVPRTITPSRLGPNPVPSATPVNGKRPSLSLRTANGSRSSGPGATPVNSNVATNNSAPGGVKAECSNCGATHTPLWRRGLNDELNCNACGLYCKLHKRPRPKSMRNSHGEGRSQTAPRQESQEVVAQCYNCHTTATPLWRKDDEGKTVCNACGLYYKLHGSARPISMKSDVIRKRARHDARRGSGHSSETPSASPGASRRASPEGNTPTLAPDSTTQSSYSSEDQSEYRPPTTSEIMNAFANMAQTQQNAHVNNGANGEHANNGYAMSYSMSSYPGPYHPDQMAQAYNMQTELQYPDASDYDVAEQARSVKRRRMSNDSGSEPPSSAATYSPYSTDSYSSASSTSHSSQRSSSMDFNFFSYGSMFRNAPHQPHQGAAANHHGNSWHPPMLPPDNSPQFVHPPMLPPDESSMDYLQQLQHDDTDSLFNAYLHPPMLPPGAEDSPKNALGSLLPHPPMLSHEWSAAYDLHDTAMQAY
ncbi:GATA Zn-finger domain-containing protein [Phanerochaete sordida]|uniref:GATA Zn-finger domain-containing protein n=1 Tax=Phanerochaete sordida TaxID=48140 RepID=A0A9P3G6C9_9APHY|nr:GATA Zn-finger domain-containing protein [Phanerochaete sordida]